jgi:hypothetical protein
VEENQEVVSLKTAELKLKLGMSLFVTGLMPGRFASRHDQRRWLAKNILFHVYPSRQMTGLF